LEDSKLDKPKQVLINKNRIIAAFDFDGTLTYSDTLIFFLLFCRGPWISLPLFVIALPFYLLFKLKIISRQRAKEILLTLFLHGKSDEEIGALGKSFATQQIERHLRPKALERIAWHKNQGHELILISANLREFLLPWAEQVGFNRVISSELEINHGKITGKLVGKNCHGHEKLRRLEDEVGPLSEVTLYAYGDSVGDRELLEAADHPFYRHLPDSRTQ
jgi:phosphatidylglycerophosphatase C